MLNDKHEIRIRGEMKKIMKKIAIDGVLFQIPTEACKTLTIIRDDGLSYITQELYNLLVEELTKYKDGNYK